MTKEILEQILQLSKEKQIPEKQACIEILGKEIQLSYYKKKFGIELHSTGKAKFTARRERIYKIDDNYFSNISEVNSYYAGFIAADGNVNKDHPNLTITLSEKDKIFLEKFVKNLKSDYPIRHYDSNGFPVSSLIVTSQQICSDLKEHFNVVPDIKKYLEEEKMRLDKYLKVSRIIKRRTVAKEACENGRVAINDKVAKPSTDVKEGDIIEITFATRKLKAKIVNIAEHVRKEEAKEMYIIIEGEEDKE